MNVIMPQLGETVEEGTVAAWHKKEGDKVAIDELLVDIETDKVATEVPSLVAGTLVKILVGSGQTVRVGTTLAIIDSGDSAGAVAPRVPSASAAPLSPAVRKLVADHGVDVARIKGSGRDGRVKRDDVLSYLQKQPATTATTRAVAEIVPCSTLRKRIAEHMVRSKATSCHVLQAVEVDFSGLDAARGALKKAWKQR